MATRPTVMSEVRIRKARMGEVEFSLIEIKFAKLRPDRKRKKKKEKRIGSYGFV
jgi:hypothetical protein